MKGKEAGVKLLVPQNCQKASDSPMDATLTFTAKPHFSKRNGVCLLKKVWVDGVRLIYLWKNKETLDILTLNKKIHTCCPVESAAHLPVGNATGKIGRKAK